MCQCTRVSGAWNSEHVQAGVCRHYKIERKLLKVLTPTLNRCKDIHVSMHTTCSGVSKKAALLLTTLRLLNELPTCRYGSQGVLRQTPSHGWRYSGWRILRHHSLWQAGMLHPVDQIQRKFSIHLSSNIIYLYCKEWIIIGWQYSKNVLFASENKNTGCFEKNSNAWEYLNTVCCTEYSLYQGQPDRIHRCQEYKNLTRRPSVFIFL